jgi:hypothetical protein
MAMPRQLGSISHIPMPMAAPDGEAIDADF